MFVLYCSVLVIVRCKNRDRGAGGVAAVQAPILGWIHREKRAKWMTGQQDMYLPRLIYTEATGVVI